MYNVVFTREAGKALREKLEGLRPEDIFILVDNNTRNFCLELLGNSLCPEDHVITIHEGEQSKTMESVMHIWAVLSEHGAKRNSVLINIGGGLITDLGGFAASCFKRGIRYIHVPTTLLAQIDASVGGKTGINFNGLKNEIGTFSVPEWVIIDNRFLKVLPQRQIMSGFAEMLKHALLADEDQLAETMLTDLEHIDSSEFMELIKQSVSVKAAIVQADPKERGIRRGLNFGHTVGHAIESVAIEKGIELYHGDAIAYGMVVALYLSMQKLGLKKKYYDVVRTFVKGKYPAYNPVAGPEDLYKLMLHDKKNERDGVNFTLLKKPGEFEIDNYCSREEILDALKVLSC